MSDYAPDVQWTRDGQVVTVGVRGRTTVNVLNSEAIGETTHTLLNVAQAERVRCIVLEGAAGRPFVGGADIQEMARLTRTSARTFITALHGLCAALTDAPVPVVAKIRGFALGGGMEVALACDIRVCARDARWGMPEVRVGLPSVIEAALMPRMAGWGRTANLLFRGGIIDAENAYRMGFTEELVDPADLDAAVDRVVHDILQCGPRAIRMQKRLLRAWRNMTLDEAVAFSIDCFEETFESDEPTEGLAAFLEKRPARYVVSE